MSETLRINSPAYYERLAEEAEKRGNLFKAAKLYNAAANVSLGAGRAARYREKAKELEAKK